MAIKKDLTDELSILVDYILENTKEGSWVTLTYRDIAKLVGTTPGSSVTKRLMENLKVHENILFKLNLDPSKSKKPLQFRFVDKETKFKAIDNKRYSNLTEEEVEFIKQKLGYRDHSELYNILSYLNYLKTMYGTEPFDLPSAEEMSDTLLLLENDIEDITNFLLNNKLLIDGGNKFRIFLKETETRTIVDSKGNNSTVDEQPRDLSVTINLQQLNDKSPSEAISILLGRLEQDQSTMRLYIEQKVLNQMDEIEKLKEQLDQGHTMLQKVLVENQELQDKNHELILLNGKLEANLDRSVRFKDDLIHATQEFLQIFNWQVQQIALKDSNMSAEAKNSKAYRANLFQQYIDVGQEFYQSIIDFTKS